MSTKISEEILMLYEHLLRAQINVIRQLRKEYGYDKTENEEKGMSQIDMAYDILCASNRPMHIDTIINTIQQRFKTQIDKESIVSALTKRVKRQDRFIKTGPNTFYLIDQKHEG